MHCQQFFFKTSSFHLIEPTGFRPRPSGLPQCQWIFAFGGLNLVQGRLYDQVCDVPRAISLNTNKSWMN